eukprot:2932638-Heterocapsa_arctica.AAC.1
MCVLLSTCKSPPRGQRDEDGKLLSHAGYIRGARPEWASISQRHTHIYDILALPTADSRAAA